MTWDWLKALGPALREGYAAWRDERAILHTIRHAPPPERPRVYRGVFIKHLAAAQGVQPFEYELPTDTGGELADELLDAIYESR